MTGRLQLATLRLAPGVARTPAMRGRIARLLEMKAAELLKGESIDLTECALYPAPVIVGISGHIGAGKDVVASYLQRTHDFTRVGWSDALKDEVATRLRRTLEAYLIERGVGPNMETSIRDALWTWRTPVTRALLQEYGSEGRRADDREYWVDRWEQRVTLMRAARIITPDTRFPNEAQRIRDLGGYLLRVDRPGHEGDAHQSETSMDTWTDYDLVLHNVGTVTDLERQVEAWWCGASVRTE